MYYDDVIEDSSYRLKYKQRARPFGRALCFLKLSDGLFAVRMWASGFDV
jgi:hypothetical protein